MSASTNREIPRTFGEAMDQIITSTTASSRSRRLSDLIQSRRSQALDADLLEPAAPVIGEDVVVTTPPSRPATIAETLASLRSQRAAESLQGARISDRLSRPLSTSAQAPAASATLASLQSQRLASQAASDAATSQQLASAARTASLRSDSRQSQTLASQAASNAAESQRLASQALAEASASERLASLARVSEPSAQSTLATMSRSQRLASQALADAEASERLSAQAESEALASQRLSSAAEPTTAMPFPSTRRSTLASILSTPAAAAESQRLASQALAEAAESERLASIASAQAPSARATLASLRSQRLASQALADAEASARLSSRVAETEAIASQRPVTAMPFPSKRESLASILSSPAASSRRVSFVQPAEELEVEEEEEEVSDLEDMTPAEIRESIRSQRYSSVSDRISSSQPAMFSVASSYRAPSERPKSVMTETVKRVGEKVFPVEQTATKLKRYVKEMPGYVYWIAAFFLLTMIGMFIWKHVLIQIKFGPQKGSKRNCAGKRRNAGVIQIGGARELEHAPDYQIILGSGSPTFLERTPGKVISASGAAAIEAPVVVAPAPAVVVAPRPPQPTIVQGGEYVFERPSVKVNFANPPATVIETAPVAVEPAAPVTVVEAPAPVAGAGASVSGSASVGAGLGTYSSWFDRMTSTY